MAEHENRASIARRELDLGDPLAGVERVDERTQLAYPRPHRGVQHRARVEHGQAVPELLAEADEGSPLSRHVPHPEPGLAPVPEAGAADRGVDPLRHDPGLREGGEHPRLLGPEAGLRVEMLPVAAPAAMEVRAAGRHPIRRGGEHLHHLPLVLALAPPPVADPEPLARERTRHPDPPALDLPQPATATVHRPDVDLDRLRRKRESPGSAHGSPGSRTSANAWRWSRSPTAARTRASSWASSASPSRPRSRSKRRWMSQMRSASASQ